MDIHIEKSGLIKWIQGLNDVTIIEKLKKIQAENSVSGDWWDETSDEAKKSIERGLKDAQVGKVHAHETVRKTYEKYL